MAKVAEAPDVQAALAIATKTKLKFSEYAVDQFDPNKVVRRLADPKKKTKWQSPLLFRGLCAWTLANENGNFVRDNVIRCIGDLLAQRQKILREKYETKPALSFAALPFDLQLVPLLVGAFEPIGGMAAIMDTCSKTELEDARRSHAHNARSVIDLMSVVHLYASTGGKANHQKKMSIQLGCELVEDLQGRRKRSKLVSQALSVDSIRDRWDATERSSALIYAASLLQYQGTPLFDILFATSPKYFHNRVLRWLKMAKRISKDVRKHVKFHADKKPRLVRFPQKMKPTKLPPPKLRLCEAIWLVERFQDVPKDWNWVSKEVQRRSLKPCAISDGSIAAGCAACARFRGTFDDEFHPIIAGY